MKLEKHKMDWLTDLTNRKETQTNELYNLVDCDFDKLVKLEEQIRNCFVFYCPGDKESVKKVMSMKPKLNYKYEFKG